MTATFDDVHAAARALRSEVQQWLQQAEALGDGDVAHRLRLELRGWGPADPAPSCRKARSATFGDIQGPDGVATGIAVPSDHLRDGDRTPIVDGLDSLCDRLPGERHGEVLHFPVDASVLPLYTRRLSDERPGHRVVRAWEVVTPAALLAMLEASREYDRAMVDAVRVRASATATPPAATPSSASAWPLLAASSAAWALVLGLALHPVAGLLTALAHAAASHRRLRTRGHIGLSADPVALPVAVATLLATVLVLRAYGVGDPARLRFLGAVMAWPVAWIAGHAAMALAALAMDAIERRKARRSTEAG